MDEVVLRRRFGTPEIMRDQLHHIAKLVDEDRIKFQVIPQDVWYPIPDCPDRFASWRSRIAHH
ncbi:MULTISPECIES: Scr1 family TA system antitoxin-like transcriptional regulator [Thermobifida]|uniref:Scr1 family TA system antitoxin-like transcriptional regulator n=1 Tax=Thermobifida TaxID=83677 RepID=UPI0002EC4971